MPPLNMMSCLQSHHCSLLPIASFPHYVLNLAFQILLQLILKVTFEQEKEVL